MNLQKEEGEMLMVTSYLNKLTLDIPYTVEYHLIVCHNKEGLKLAKASYGDYSNKLYLSDNGLEDTISIDTKWDSRLFGEFRILGMGCK